MIGKIISLPFKILAGIVGLFTGILKVGSSIFFGTLRFLLNHVVGTFLGATIGFLLGRKHVGVKLFKRKHHK